MFAKAFRNAARKAHERKWDKIFVAVDWHDTVCKSTYSGTKDAYEFYEECIPALQDASRNKAICLILYTSSYNTVTDKFVRFCRSEYGINFEYVNENPEVTNTDYGDFDSKFYYDLLLDDKAGFEPEEDWAIFAWQVENYFGDCYK